MPNLPISQLPYQTSADTNSLFAIVYSGDSSPVTSQISLDDLWRSSPFGNMVQNSIPETDNTYQIGNITNLLKSIFAGGLIISGATLSGATAGNIIISPLGGALVVNGDILPGNGFNLGSPTDYFANAFIGPESLNILPENPLTGTTIVLRNADNILSVLAGGFAVDDVTAGFSTFQVDPLGQIFIKSDYKNPNNSGVLEIIGNASGFTTYPLNPGTMIHVTGHDDETSRIVNDSYGDIRWSQYGGRNAGGTAQFPTETKEGPILRFAGIGWRPGAGFGNSGDLPSTWIDLYSLGVFSADSTPTEFRFYATKPNEYQGSLVMRLAPSGITLPQSGSTITFGDTSIQETAYLGTATLSQIGGVQPDGVTIGITGGTISVIGGAGTSGTSGIDGTSGTSGTSGIDGTSGTSGTSGIDGTSGTSGTSGIDGTSGTSGTSGIDGTSGTSGTSGIDGTSGTSGIDGTSGTSGIDGTSGTSGIDGTSGTSGTSGIDGTSGTSGTSGINGTSGTSGTSGINGTSGTSGTSGINGTSGTSGTSGINGTSGTSGSSGINGTSGTSGVSSVAAQRAYGSYLSTVTQTAASTTVAYSMSADTVVVQSGITVVDGSKFTLASGGTYNIQFSVQANSTAGGQNEEMDIWFALNGTNIPNSNTTFTINSNNNVEVGALNFVDTFNAGDFIEIKWSVSDIRLQLRATGTKINPTRPAVPSVIVTVTQV